MPIQTYNGFKRMTGFCKVKVPQEITDTLEGIKDNDEAVRNFGVDLGVKMCRYASLLLCTVACLTLRGVPLLAVCS